MGTASTKAKAWKSGALGRNEVFLRSFFRCLDASSLGRCACVCKKWRLEVKNSEGWLRQAALDFGERSVKVAMYGGEGSCRDVYMGLLWNPGLAHCCFGTLFEEAWARVHSWSLEVTTDSCRHGNEKHMPSLDRLPTHQWMADAREVERFPQGFRVSFNVDDWVMFDGDESFSNNSNVRVCLVANVFCASMIRRFVMEDLCPFAIPMRRHSGISSVNVWNDGGSIEFVGLEHGSRKKMIVFSMHFMRLIASMQSLQPFARLLPMPRLMGSFFMNVQNEPGKLRLAAMSPKAAPDEVWVHLDIQDRCGQKVGVLDGMVVNLHDMSCDVAGTTSFWGDTSDISFVDGGVYDSNRRLLNGFSGVPCKRSMGAMGRRSVLFDINLAFLNLYKLMRLQIELGGASRQDRWQWDVKDQRNRGGFDFRSEPDRSIL